MAASARCARPARPVRSRSAQRAQGRRARRGSPSRGRAPARAAHPAVRPARRAGRPRRCRWRPARASRTRAARRRGRVRPKRVSVTTTACGWRAPARPAPARSASSAPGRAPSTTASASRARARAPSRPAGVRRSSASRRLPTPPSWSTSGSSGRRGSSTRVTAAPSAASIRVPTGPAMTRVRSSTRAPAAGRSPGVAGRRRSVTGAGVDGTSGAVVAHAPGGRTAAAAPPASATARSSVDRRARAHGGADGGLVVRRAERPQQGARGARGSWRACGSSRRRRAGRPTAARRRGRAPLAVDAQVALAGGGHGEAVDVERDGGGAARAHLGQLGGGQQRAPGRRRQQLLDRERAREHGPGRCSSSVAGAAGSPPSAAQVGASRDIVSPPCRDHGEDEVRVAELVPQVAVLERRLVGGPQQVGARPPPPAAAGARPAARASP